VGYDYDAVGNRLVQNDGGQLTTSTYDAANQLVTEAALAGGGKGVRNRFLTWAGRFGSLAAWADPDERRMADWCITC